MRALRPSNPIDCGAPYVQAIPVRRRGELFADKAPLLLPPPPPLLRSNHHGPLLLLAALWSGVIIVRSRRPPALPSEGPRILAEKGPTRSTPPHRSRKISRKTMAIDFEARTIGLLVISLPSDHRIESTSKAVVEFEFFERLKTAAGGGRASWLWMGQWPMANGTASKRKPTGEGTKGKKARRADAGMERGVSSFVLHVCQPRHGNHDEQTHLQPHTHKSRHKTHTRTTHST